MSSDDSDYCGGYEYYPVPTVDKDGDNSDNTDNSDDSNYCGGYEYYPVPTVDMDEYLQDENKFRQLPWEDAM